ncbi:ubiquitin-related domain-containing protein [Schizophyllum fasciatum]
MSSTQTREASFVLPSVVVEPLSADALYPPPTPPEATGSWLTRRFPYDQPCDSARTSITRVNLPLVEEEDGMSPSVAPSIRSPAAPPPDEVVDDDDAHTQDGEHAHAHDDKAGSMTKLPADEDGGPPPSAPQAILTFLTVTARRKTLSFDPETTVGKVKELVWDQWPEDWQEERPPAPAYLRILYLGKILQDHDTLSNLKIPVHTLSADVPPPQPTIVHLSVRSCAPSGDDSDPKKKRKGDSDDEDARHGCCSSCIIC